MKKDTEKLERYFTLFDESRVSSEARANLINIFSQDMSFVLNGYKKDGIREWEKFLDLIFKNNIDIKHMYEGWNFNEESKRYETSISNRYAIHYTVYTGI